MQRHPALQPLSRDHHDGLVIVRALNQALDGTLANREAAVRRFVTLWHEEFQHHCHLEEQWILPHLDERMRDRMLEDHRRIREFAIASSELRSNPSEPLSIDFIGELAAVFRNHIRWEEREVFQELQDTLRPDELSKLSIVTAPLDDARRSRLGHLE